MRSRRKSLAVLSTGLIVGGLALGQPQIAAAAAPAGSASAVAVMGTIALPGSGFLRNPYVSDDDTVYVPTEHANYVAVIAPGKTSGSLDDSIAVAHPRAVVVSPDDTVFIAEYLLQRVSAFAPGAASASYAISVPDYPHGLAMNQDETLAISQFQGATGGDVSLVSRNATVLTATIAAIFTASYSPSGLATDSAGNFYVGSDASSIKVIPSNGTSVSTTITGLSGPVQLGLTSDDTVLVVNRFTNNVAVVPLGDTSPSASVSVGLAPVALAMGPDGKAYVSNYSSNSVSRVDPVTLQAETILTGMTSTHGLVVNSAGTIYVTTNSSPMAVVVAQEVGAAVTPTSGSAGSAVEVALTGAPAGIVMDDSTIENVWWGDDTVPFTRNAGVNSVSVTPPVGSGSVPIVVEVNGGNALTAGTFTYSSAPTPAPAYPPSAPLSVVAEPGDASATVSWQLPQSSGSFPITNYQVRSAPSGGTCLTTTLSCQVQGLANGSAYTFEVRALNGGGWGPWSTASDSVTPIAPARPSVLISGSRESVRGKHGIVVNGTSSGLGMGAILKPWTRVAGQSTFTQGAAQILVSMSGDFDWERRAAKRISVYVQTPDGSARSNTLTIR